MIKDAITNAENLHSKIPTSYFDHMQGGLSSQRIWHLLNNLASKSTSYLEVGTYMGSTLMAALYENPIYAVAIDNFCMKPTTRNHFFQNTKKLKFEFIEDDCFKVDTGKIKPIELYFFDGEHSFESQYKALVHFIPCMKEEFIYVCDDWTNSAVKEGTHKAIEDAKLTIVESYVLGDGKQKDREGWWCGLGIFKLRK